MKIIYDAEDIERHRQYGSEGGKKAAANMTEAARKEAFASHWALKGQDVLPIMGPIGAQYWDQLVANADPRAILHQLEYRIEASSARKPNKDRDAANMQQAMQVLLPMLQQYAFQTGQFDQLNAFLSDWAKSIDMDPEKYLLKAPPPPPAPVAQAGGPPTPAQNVPPAQPAPPTQGGPPSNGQQRGPRPAMRG